MNYLEIFWTSHFQNGPSLFKLFQAYYDVTTGHMTLRFEIFWRETTWQEENRQVWSGRIHNCEEFSSITALGYGRCESYWGKLLENWEVVREA